MPTYKSIRRSITRWATGLMVFATPVTAFAQAIDGSSAQEWIAAFTVYAIAMLNILTWIAFFYLTKLLDPLFIFNSAEYTQFETVLNNIWQLSRDLMNIAFAVILIGAAVYTVVKADQGVAKKYLPNVIVCIVLVNFSWFVPRVVIDLGNVGAAAIYGIPSLLTSQGVTNPCFVTLKGENPNPSGNASGLQGTEQSPDTWKCNCAAVTNAKFFVGDDAAEAFEDNGWYCPLGSAMCLQTVTLDPNNTAGFLGVLNGLVVNHGRLQGLATVPPVPSDDGDIGAIIIFILREIIVLAIHVAIFFPLAALAFAFAIRIPILWLTIAFMPFVMLRWALPVASEYPKKIMDHFLKAALLPAITAIPLTVGYILVNAGSQIIDPSISVDIPLTNNINNFWELLWVGMTLGVLWVGVFSTLEKMGPMAFGAKFFKNFGQGLGRKVLSAPGNIPFLPGFAGGKGGNVGSAPAPQKAGDDLKGKINPPPTEEKKSGLGRFIDENNNPTPSSLKDMANQKRMIEGLNSISNKLEAGGVKSAELNRLLGKLSSDHGLGDVNFDNAKQKFDDIQNALKRDGIAMSSLGGSIEKFKKNLDKVDRS